GMGKSRLAAEIIKLATEHGLTGFGGDCASHGGSVSYLVWRNIWRGIFGVEPSWSAPRQLFHLEAQLARANPQYLQRMPLLAAVLNIAIPDNAMTQALDAKLRKESLEALLLECLSLRARHSPLILILEDCHWIDPLSADLLEFIARNLSG